MIVRVLSGVEVNSTANGYQIGMRNTYSTDCWFFLGAAIVEIVCILFMAPTYWGWWRLRRHFSFSPLEIAKAFEAPLLANGNSNSSGSDLIREYGDVYVRYGAKRKDEGDSTRRLAFVESSSAEWPRQGDRSQ